MDKIAERLGWVVFWLMWIYAGIAGPAMVNRADALACAKEGYTLVAGEGMFGRTQWCSDADGNVIQLEEGE